MSRGFDIKLGFLDPREEKGRKRIRMDSDQDLAKGEKKRIGRRGRQGSAVTEPGETN